MLLGKELSLVADSTVSSSPHSDSKSNALSHIHRPVRTYGRRCDDGPTCNGVDAPSSSLPPSSASRDSIHNTAPPGLSEEVPPSSPPHFSDCEISMSCDEENSPQSLPKFEFSWRKSLRRLDEDDDLNTSHPFISNAEDDASKLESTNAIAPAAIDDDDVFGGSHPSVDGRSPLNSVSAEDFRLSSPQVSTRTRTRHKPKVIRDSDSDSEPLKESSSATPASALHLLNTPHSGSSSTQPTSDDDMPVKISTKLPRKTARLSRVCDTFTDASNNDETRSEETRKKKTKIKVCVTSTSL
jgi:mediator of replication checkpoint protein 1